MPILALPALASPLAGERPAPEIDQAFVRMYNTDFRGAHTLLDRYISAQPSDPLGYAVRASAYLFSELYRLGILESEFFADDKRIIEKKKLAPDADVETKSVSDYRRRADARGKNPGSRIPTTKMLCSPWPSP